MNYLTNYYRNLSEQLQQKLNLLESAVSEEEEKAKRRAEHVLHWGPRFLFSETTGKPHHHFSSLPEDEQAMWAAHHRAARDVFHNKDFMGKLPAKPKEREKELAKEIAKHGDIGLEDAMRAMKAHEMAILMAGSELQENENIVGKPKKAKLPPWVDVDGSPKNGELPSWVTVDKSPSEKGSREDGRQLTDEQRKKLRQKDRL